MKWSENTPTTKQQPRKHPTQVKPHTQAFQAYKVVVVSGRGKWTYKAFEETMYAIENNNTTLRKASELQSIPLNSLFNHLNDKT
jgi:hypothetical protein